MNHLSDAIHSHSFQAMGCQMSIWIELEAIKDATEHLRRAELIFRQLEQRLSRFDPKSELSQLNSTPEEWVPVSNELWHVIQTAIIFATETNGLFDPTVLTAIEEAGYRRSFKEIDGTGGQGQHTTNATVATKPQNLLRGRWQEIKSNPDQQSCWLPNGVGIDLGGIAKGWTAQLAVTYLEQYGPTLVDAAGDVTAGSGPQGWPGWPVGIARPGHGEMADEAEPEESHMARLWLSHSTLATSGIDYRHWELNGEQRHHLIDPASGKPAETDLLTVSVLDRHACRAEAWATAAMVAGKEQGYSALSLRQLPAACTSHNPAGKLEMLLTPKLHQLLTM